jgi:hypothetical protein
MMSHVEITDVAIWVKHIDHPGLRERLRGLPDEASLTLEIDGVVGNWSRMKTGRDGRPTEAIKPYGPMKKVWSEWYRSRKGASVPIREVKTAESYLASVSKTMDEWNSREDDEAFRDL